MSWKTFFFCVLLVLAGVFVYYKSQILGSPSSNFNQTTRFSLGAHPVLRTIFGLHSDGDARSELLSGQGHIAIEWYKPQTEDVDQSVIQQFADTISRYTGRMVDINFAGSVDDSVMPTSNLKSFVIKADGEKPTGTTLLMVIFDKDYSPRPDGELSTTFEESSIVVSLDAHRSFLQSQGQNLDTYLLSSLLHEFGHQIGLQHNQDPACIMDEHAGINGQPVESYGLSDPQDYCPEEQLQIQQLKNQY